MALSTIVRARRSERKLHHARTREGRPRGGVSKSLESNLVRSVSRNFSFSSVLPLATFRSTIDLRQIEIGSSEATRHSLACTTISFALAEFSYSVGSREIAPDDRDFHRKESDDSFAGLTVLSPFFSPRREKGKDRCFMKIHSLRIRRWSDLLTVAG